MSYTTMPLHFTFNSKKKTDLEKGKPEALLVNKYAAIWRANILGRQFRSLDPRHQQTIIRYKSFPLGNEGQCDFSGLSQEMIQDKHMMFIAVGYLNIFSIIMKLYKFSELDPASYRLPKLIITDPSIDVIRFWTLMIDTALVSKTYDCFVKRMRSSPRHMTPLSKATPDQMPEIFATLYKGQDPYASFPVFREILLRTTIAPYDWSGKSVVNLGFYTIDVDKEKTGVVIYASNVYEFLEKKVELFSSISKPSVGSEVKPSDQMLDNIAALRPMATIHTRTEAHLQNPGIMLPTKALIFSGDVPPSTIKQTLQDRRYNTMNDEPVTASRQPRQSRV